MIRGRVLRLGIKYNYIARLFKHEVGGGGLGDFLEDDFWTPPPSTVLYMDLMCNTWILLIMWPQRPAPYRLS